MSYILIKAKHKGIKLSTSVCMSGFLLKIQQKSGTGIQNDVGMKRKAPVPSLYWAL